MVTQPFNTKSKAGFRNFGYDLEDPTFLFLFLFFETEALFRKVYK